MTICDVENETIEFYKDKVCVSFVNKDYAENGVTKMVKAFEDYDQAIAFVEMKKEEGTYSGFSNTALFPEEGIIAWLDINKDTLLPTTRRN
jgi:hypothetical protein|tara:strand:+ start:251 stop:523 length:273 start_codon:yes stop_codon:yes gene_type:complete